MISADIPNAVNRERIIRSGERLFVSLSFGAATCGGVAVIMHEFAFVALTHLIAALAGGAAGALADRRRLGGDLFPWAMALTIPLFGGIAAYMLLHGMKKPRSGRLIEEYSLYLDEAAPFKDSVPALEAPVPTELVSLGDVLSRPDSGREQRIAIEYLSEIETPAALEILRKAASTAGGEAYFFSMTTLTQMEDRMLAQLDELESMLSQADETNTDGELLLKTASAYLDFVYYHFVAGERRSEYLLRAETLLNQAINNDLLDANEMGRALILAGRVQLALRNAKTALRYFNLFIKRNPTLWSGYLWRAEARYKLGEYQLLREDCAKAEKIGNIPQNMQPVLDFWLKVQ